MVITSESDAVLWASLQEKWLEEMQPLWLNIGGIQYLVAKKKNDEPFFIPRNKNIVELDIQDSTPGVERR